MDSISVSSLVLGRPPLLAGLRIATQAIAIWVAMGSAADLASSEVPVVAELNSPTSEAPTGELRLEDALRIATENQPRLAAARFESQARAGEVVQAGLLPNPSASLEVEDIGGSGERRSFETSQTTLSLSQLVELGGKRGKRRAVAEDERDLAAWDHAAVRVEILTAATTAFVDALAAQERVTLAKELVDLASKSLQTVEATIRSGAVSPIEGERARVLLSQSELEQDRAQKEMDAGRTVLAAVLGLDVASFSSLAGTLSDTKAPPPLESYVAAIEGNPDLARWSTEIAKQRDALALATAKRLPDVTLSAGPRYFADDGSFAAVVALSVPLPLFDRNQGEIQAAQFRLAKAPHERRSAELEIRAALALAYQDLSSAFQRIGSLRDSVIPRSESVYRGLLDGYARGLFRHVDVLDAQRTLFELRGECLTALASYHRAAAELARLTGTPLDPTKASTRKVNP